MRKGILGFLGIGSLFFLIYFLSQVFSGGFILPQAFNLGPLTIHYYGLMMALAAAAGFYLAIKRAKAFNIDLKQAEDLLFWLATGGFIGARLYHVASSFNYYLLRPADIIKVWQGGLSIYGAIFGGLIVILIFSRLLTLDARRLLDWLAPSLILGQIIGRFGNLFNYEAFGYPTSLPWKMFVPSGFRPENYSAFDFFHPFFLYEALGNLLILVILTRIFRKNIQPGVLFFSYLLLYNVLRFGLEFLRIDSTFIYGFRLNAGVSLLLIITGFAGIFYLNNHAKTP